MIFLYTVENDKEALQQFLCCWERHRTRGFWQLLGLPSGHDMHIEDRSIIMRTDQVFAA